MRKLITVTACSIAAFALTPVLAASHNDAKLQKQNDKVWLYAAPNKSSAVVSKLAPNGQLIPIWKKGDWIKVGDASNGQVGWVNQEQYQQARRAYYQTTVQTVYINMKRDENGKPVLNVVAYNNGKKVSDKKAREIYNQIRAQQKRQYRNAMRDTYWMNRDMDQAFWSMDQAFNSPWMNNPWPAPMIVVPSPAMWPALPPQPSNAKDQKQNNS